MCNLKSLLEASQQTGGSGSGLQIEGMACGTPRNTADMKTSCFVYSAHMAMSMRVTGAVHSAMHHVFCTTLSCSWFRKPLRGSVRASDRQ